MLGLEVTAKLVHFLISSELRCSWLYPSPTYSEIPNNALYYNLLHIMCTFRFALLHVHVLVILSWGPQTAEIKLLGPLLDHSLGVLLLGGSLEGLR